MISWVSLKHNFKLVSNVWIYSFSLEKCQANMTNSLQKIKELKKIEDNAKISKEQLGWFEFEIY